MTRGFYTLPFGLATPLQVFNLKNKDGEYLSLVSDYGPAINKKVEKYERFLLTCLNDGTIAVKNADGRYLGFTEASVWVGSQYIGDHFIDEYERLTIINNGDGSISLRNKEMRHLGFKGNEIWGGAETIGGYEKFYLASLIPTLSNKDDRYFGFNFEKVWGDATQPGRYEYFFIIGNSDGTISFMNADNNYLNVEGSTVSGGETRIGACEKFKLINNNDGSITLQNKDGKYFGFNRDGVWGNETRKGGYERLRLNQGLVSLANKDKNFLAFNSLTVTDKHLKIGAYERFLPTYNSDATIALANKDGNYFGFKKGNDPELWGSATYVGDYEKLSPINNGDGTIALANKDKNYFGFKKGHDPEIWGSAEHVGAYEKLHTKYSYPVKDLAVCLHDANKRVVIPNHKAYQFGKGDFTVEAWVCGFNSDTRGPCAHLITKGTGNDTGFEIWYEDDKLAFFLHANKGESKQWVETKSLKIGDGLWHHIACVRRGGELSLYMDGHRLAVDAHKIGLKDDETIAINSDADLIFGAPKADGSKVNHHIDLSQVKLWSEARDIQSILASMHYEMKAQFSPQSLIGQWNFNNKAIAKDSSRTANHGAYEGNPEIIETDIQFTTPKPHLAVQTQYMQDYTPKGNSFNDNGFEEKNTFRTIVSAIDYDGQFYHDKDKASCEIHIWCDEEIDALVNGKPARLPRVSIDNAPYKAETNANGQISIVLPADAHFTAPDLSLRAGFMEDIELVKVSPDRHLHYKMATVTGKQLKGEHDPDAKIPDLTRDKPTLLKGENQKHADTVAKLVRNMMAVSAEHQNFSKNPAEDIAANGLDADYLKNSTLENAYTTPRGFTAHNDMTRIHCHHGQEAPVKVPNAEAMETPHFEVDFETGTTRNLSAAEVASYCASLSSIEAACLMTKFQQNLMGDSHHPEVTISLDDYQALYKHTLSSFHADEELLGSFWDWIKKAAKVVAKTVIKVIEGIGKVIKTVVLTIVDAAGDAMAFAIHTIQDAIDKVVDIFKKVKILIGDALKFFTSLFNWDDILTVHEAMYNYVDKGFDKMADNVGFAREKVHDFLNGIEQKFTQHYDDAKRQYGDKHIGNDHNPMPAREGVQAGWVKNTIAEHHNKIKFSQTPTFEDIITDILNSLKEDARIGKDIFDKFTNLFTKYGNSFDSFNFGDLLEFIKSVLADVVRIVNNTVTTLLAIIEKIIRIIKNLLTKHIDIPIITWLYETVITKGRSKLSVLDFLCLGAAIPATITAKLLLGRSSFSDEEKVVFGKLKTLKKEDMFWFDPNRRTAIEVSDFTKRQLNLVSWVLGLATAGFLGCRFIFQGIVDAFSISEVPGFGWGISTLATLSSFSLLFMQVTSFPLGFAITDLDLWVNDVVFWLLRFIFVIFGFVMAFASVSEAAKKAVSPIVLPIVSVCGVVSVAMSIGLGTWGMIKAKDEAARLNWGLKGTQLAIASVAPLLQPVKLIKNVPPTPLVAVKAICVKVIIFSPLIVGAVLVSRLCSGYDKAFDGS